MSEIDWTAAGVLLALAGSAVAIVRGTADRRRRDADLRRRHAEQVTCWAAPNTGEDRLGWLYEVHVANDSGTAVSNVRVELYAPWNPVIIERFQPLDDATDRTVIRLTTLPPHSDYPQVVSCPDQGDGGWDHETSMVVVVSFTDSANRSWRRSVPGDLREVKHARHLADRVRRSRAALRYLPADLRAGHRRRRELASPGRVRTVGSAAAWRVRRLDRSGEEV